MWYRFAAYGTIDLQKYIPEKLGEDFDVDAEISNLLTSSLNDKKLDFDLLNENLLKSPLASLISVFRPTNHITDLASMNRDSKIVKLSTRFPLDVLIQALRHELRHFVDKINDYHKGWINKVVIEMAENYFKKYKNKLLDQNKNFVYDIDRMIYEMIFIDKLTKDKEFANLSDEEQIDKVANTAKKINSKEKDQLFDVFKRLVQEEDLDEIGNDYYYNDPREYSTTLSDINENFSPEALNNFVQRNSIDSEYFIDMMKNILSKLNKDSDFTELRYINKYAANDIQSIFKYSKNPQMIRNVYKILSDNFQKYVSQYAYSTDLTKKAKKEYNAPRTGKKKKRWSVKYKKSINCNNPKGFSQKNYCKRKRSGGAYKTEE
jgi:hypothetical protein